MSALISQGSPPFSFGVPLGISQAHIERERHVWVWLVFLVVESDSGIKRPQSLKIKWHTNVALLSAVDEGKMLAVLNG